MDDYFDPSNPDFATQEQMLLQQQARIKALRGVQAVAAPAPDPGWTSAVTGAKMLGIQPKQNILGAALPVIANTVADYKEKDLNEKRTQLNAAEQDNLSKWISGAPQDTDAGYQPTNAPSATNPNGNLVQASYDPGKDVSSQDMMNYYAQGLKGSNPLVKDYANKGIETEMFDIPKEDRVLKATLAKQTAENQQKALDRQNKLDAATIKAKAGGAMNMEGTYDASGALTGGLDKKTGKVYVMGTDGQLTENTGGGAAGGAGGAAGPMKAGSAAFQKQQQELQTKQEETNDVLGMIKQGRDALNKNPTYGVGGAAAEGFRRALGKEPTPQDEAAQALDTLAGNLAAKYPRGPGSITDKERDLFVQYMGSVNNRTLAPSVRLKNLQLVEDLMNNSLANSRNAKTPGVTPGAGPSHSGAVQIAGDEDFDRLPRGARFVGPDGVTRVKP